MTYVYQVDIEHSSEDSNEIRTTSHWVTAHSIEDVFKDFSLDSSDLNTEIVLIQKQVPISRNIISFKDHIDE